MHSENSDVNASDLARHVLKGPGYGVEESEGQFGVGMSSISKVFLLPAVGFCFF
jgi:hypothetical protein